ncbi:DUF805 domain-containing protein [Hymenobacter cellulosivorans]|uniref:DUF805 domain-containing protein n=1 Tax=Hymenobacter cellulosivorans TaxID=2932249 RepID=A0ABY4F3L1_9BACT|nr:DUF805 domain-containing protein [Hymenobacter cellulosivorans]UOQ51248.1 DUF805 domain-containing protein [Hymenobacter cellulosivorans]
MHYFINALKNHYADFNGRARRAEYWYFMLFNIIVSFVLGFVAGMLKMPWLASLFSLAVLIPGIAVAVRRMHDVGKSGWYLLIPIYNIILACTEGEKGPNAYGADPKGATATVASNPIA